MNEVQGRREEIKEEIEEGIKRKGGRTIKSGGRKDEEQFIHKKITNHTL